MVPFSCKPGECVKCCTDFVIPVTLGDLYRSLVYERSKGNNRALYGIFDERCSGWMLVSDKRSPYPLVVPVSRKPCYNLDTENKMCEAHDAAQYVGCRQCPEENLLKLRPGMLDFNEHDARRAVLFSQLECLRGVELDAEREKQLWEFIELSSDEIFITGMTLNPALQPAVTSYSEAGLKKADPELRNRMRWLSTPAYASRLWANVRKTQRRYMDLFGVETPDYTKPALPTSETHSAHNAKAGRNDPCGSGMKFKKCCLNGH